MSARIIGEICLGSTSGWAIDGGAPAALRRATSRCSSRISATLALSYSTSGPAVHTFRTAKANKRDTNYPREGSRGGATSTQM